MMSRKGIKVLGFSLIVLVMGSVFTSCKAAHEVCPAYTKAKVSSTDIGV